MNPILEMRDVAMYFPVKRGLLSTRAVVRALDGVSLSLVGGETFGLVGESGCGKSTLGRCILRINRLTAGTITFDGVRVSGMTARQFMPYRRKISMIFQDPNASLNPRLRVRDLVAEPLRFQEERPSRREADRMVDRVLEDVGLRSEYRNRYPHEFSGGQQQRIGIARALVLQPSLIVCDEPVSALDVSVRAQIINLLNALQEEHHLTYLFISHDLSVVKFISRHLAIMYLGKLVEMGDSDEIFTSPAHPYTVSLLAAAPVPDPLVRTRRQLLRGEVPSPLSIPQGCRFHPRCPYKTSICVVIEPALSEIAPGHRVACHNYMAVYGKAGLTPGG
jgi:oligopeptide/dipeptide ABC transporter ATP-binding protein